METVTAKARLVNDIKYAKDDGRVLDVSNMTPNIRGIRFTNRLPLNYRGNKIMIDNVPIISSNYDSYKLATDILGEDYHYLADYFLIILEIKKGDKEYIKKIAKTNYPALVSNGETFNFALKILGPDYKYLMDYYALLKSIKDDDYVGVVLFLHIFDPRDHDDFAYRIATQYGNQKYIKLIEDKIIKRDWLERQALENVLGIHSPYKELHQSIRKL
jgi:hypothetical protein